MVNTHHQLQILGILSLTTDNHKTAIAPFLVNAQWISLQINSFHSLAAVTSTKLWAASVFAQFTHFCHPLFFSESPFQVQGSICHCPKGALAICLPFQLLSLSPPTSCALCAFPAGCAKTGEPARHRHGGYNTPSNPPPAQQQQHYNYNIY